MREEIIKKILEFRKERDWEQFHTPENLAKSISVESGELLECFLWNGSKFNLEDVKEELADILNNCYLLAFDLNLDLDQIVLNKLEKNKSKYPVNKCKGKCTKYNKL